MSPAERSFPAVRTNPMRLALSSRLDCAARLYSRVQPAAPTGLPAPSSPLVHPPRSTRCSAAPPDQGRAGSPDCVGKSTAGDSNREPCIRRFPGLRLRCHESVRRRPCARWTTAFPRPARGRGHDRRGRYARTGLTAAARSRRSVSPKRSRPSRRGRTITFDGQRSCDPADPRDRFDASPRQARAIAWATRQAPASPVAGTTQERRERRACRSRSNGCLWANAEATSDPQWRARSSRALTGRRALRTPMIRCNSYSPCSSSLRVGERGAEDVTMPAGHACVIIARAGSRARGACESRVARLRRASADPR